MTFDTNADFDQFLNGIQNAGFEYPTNEDGGTPPEGDPDEPPEDDEPIPTDDPNTDPGPQQQGPDTFRIGDRDVPADEVRALYEMGRMFREGSLPPSGQQAASDTGVAGTGASTATPPPPEPPAPPPLPDFIDKDDPTQMGVWAAVQEQRTQFNDRLTQLQQGYEQMAHQNRMRELVDNSKIALAQFRSEHPALTDDDVNTIIPLAQPIADAMVAKYGNDVQGLKRAFYVAGLEFEGTRDKVLGTSPKQQSADRKRKIGSLSGNSGASTRSEQPRPQLTTDRQSREEFAKALVESYGANGRLS